MPESVPYNCSAVVFDGCAVGPAVVAMVAAADGGPHDSVY